MIKRFLSLFELPGDDSAEDPAHRVRLAAAALLIETARADFVQDAEEETALAACLAGSLQLSAAEVATLMQQATDSVDEATSLFQYTRVINDHYSAEQKQSLIDAMWDVAFADGRVDKYEEHLIRQVAELTYVPHEAFIRSKLRQR